MKKLILIAAMALGVMSAQAAETVQGSKFFDNWSIGLKGGAVAPFQGYAFWPASRGIAGIELRKEVTPAFGIGFEGEWTVNTSSWGGYKSANVFDHQYVGVFGAVNFMNWFAGYTGSPRVFELELVAGAGWLHSYYPKSQAEDANTWGTKVGLNFNFNLGASKAWTIGIKPAILWNMGASGYGTYLGHNAQYDGRHAYVEMEAGITYHFKNSNGTHSFNLVRPYDQEEVDALNAQINALRGQLDACGANNAALQQRINALQSELDACLARPAVVKEVTRDLDNVRYIFFAQGSSVIQANQQPNVEMVAEYLKNNPSSKVVIKGYASPEGSLAFNEKLAQKRADVVKNALINKYKVAADRITAEGQGIGKLFSEPTWNRVSVCTVD